MTRQEAQAEAERRWPSGGAVVWTEGSKLSGQVRYVGQWSIPIIAWKAPVRRPLGKGNTWEEAFRDADARSSR